MSKKKILLAEDDDLMRNLYHDILASEYEVEIAEDGEVALSKIESTQYDLILLDMLMPKMNGNEVITKALSGTLKKHKPNVVFLTNLEGGELKDITKLGYPHIIKSEHTPEQFIIKIKSYL